MKLLSWNVNGYRAILNKGFSDFVLTQNPDILCLQEIKAQDVALPLPLSHYHLYWNAAKKKGYSGTAVFSKEKPITVVYDLGVSEHDNEGRVMTVEFNDFLLVNVYVPNSGRELIRLDYRAQWDKDFLAYLKKIEKKKPVILCGDLNVAHTEIDLANPKSNYNKTAGYTQREIDGLQTFIDGGFVDTFRQFNKEPKNYSYWSYMFGAREKNVGWRIDYFLVSKVLMDNVKSAFILPEILGSDHCPVGIILK